MTTMPIVMVYWILGYPKIMAHYMAFTKWQNDFLDDRITGLRFLFPDIIQTMLAVSHL
jgi:hypothetical protein